MNFSAIEYLFNEVTYSWIRGKLVEPIHEMATDARIGCLRWKCK